MFIKCLPHVKHYSEHWGYISEANGQKSCPPETFIVVQAYALQSIARYVLERGVCWKKGEGGKGSAGGRGLQV